jgi:hypothetical protein
MMKIAALLVALALVLPPTSASAECAWVLWVDQTTITTIRETEWSPLQGTANVKDCEAERRDMVKFQGTPKDAKDAVKVNGNIVTRPLSSGLLISRYVCLPDTVDPRGPKGR